MIGACPCGAQNVSIAPTQIAALIDKGMSDPICRSCEQRVLAKLQQRKAQEMKRKGVSQREITEAVEALSQKAKDEIPATTVTDATSKGE